MNRLSVKKRKGHKISKKYWPLYLMMLPGCLYLLINNYIPMAGIVIAFKKVNFSTGIFDSPFVGLVCQKDLPECRFSALSYVNGNPELYCVCLVQLRKRYGK